jgi:hypothetical protein
MLGSFDCSADRPLPPQFDLVLSLGSDPTAQWASAFSGRFVMGDASPIAMSGGDDFHRAPTGIIDSGQLTTEVRTFPFRSATIRTTTPLYAGDSVSFVASSKNDASIRPVSHIIAQRRSRSFRAREQNRSKLSDWARPMFQAPIWHRLYGRVSVRRRNGSYCLPHSSY